MLLSPELICPPGDSNEIINAGTAQWFQTQKISTCIARPQDWIFLPCMTEPIYLAVTVQILQEFEANVPWLSENIDIHIFYCCYLLDQEEMSLTDVTHILMQWHRFEEKRSFLKVGYVLCTVITDIMFTLFYRSGKISCLWMRTRLAVFSFLFQLGALDMEFLLQTVLVYDFVTYLEICGCRYCPFASGILIYSLLSDSGRF